MIDDIILPHNISFEIDKQDPKRKGRVFVEPLHPGYGDTIANSLRRVLLSSLPGFAVHAIKIEGVEHEFSHIEGVKEDVIEIMLNMKKLRFLVHSEESVSISLKASGQKEVTAGDITAADNVEVINPDQRIATLTSKNATLDMEIFISKGRGYVPVEQQQHNQREVGLIAIDSMYTPVHKVSFQIDNTRVGQLTNFEKITMDIETDGTITPEEAIKFSAKILVDHYTLLQGDLKAPEKAEVKKEDDSAVKKDDKTIAELKFSTRTFNALQKNSIHTLSDLTAKTEDDLLMLDGFGKTALEEVNKKLKRMGLELSK
jgi:DNA-directed RNA polymerase subunit alpha